MSSAAAPQADQVLAAVADLAEQLPGRGAEIEQAGRLPADVVEALREARVFQLWMPRELGGLEAEPETVLRVVETLAAADGSTGWCVATGLASNTVGAFVPEAGARQLYRTGLEQAGGALMPGGRAVPQPDGAYLVTGRWSFGSGVQHCDWVVGGTLVAAGSAGEPPTVRAVVMPAAEVEFLETWDAIGLRGTASVDFAASGVRVPAEHTLVPDRLTPWPAGSMWRLPLPSLLFPVLAGVPLGLGRRAVEELAALALTKTPFRSAKLLADREVLQADLARADALVQAGHAYLLAALQALWQAAADGAAPTVAQRAQVRLAAAHAAAGASEAVQLCYRAAGSTAIWRGHPLERLLRDVTAATQHYGIGPAVYEAAGRVLLGKEPDPGL